MAIISNAIYNTNVKSVSSVTTCPGRLNIFNNINAINVANTILDHKLNISELLVVIISLNDVI